MPSNDWWEARNATPNYGIEERGIEARDFSMLTLVGGSIELPAVTIDSALTVPAVAAAVAFLSRTLAVLPLHCYRQTDKGPVKLTGKIAKVLHENWNTEQSGFKARQHFWQQVFTGGRGLAWIERNGANVEAIWPMDPTKVVIRRERGRTTYQWDGKDYPAADVIDVPFMLKANGLDHYGPVQLGAKAIQLALAMNDYGSQFFAGGGVPPLALSGPLPQGPEAMKRAMADVHRAIEAAKASSKPIFPMPPGHELKQVGFDPDKGQMVEARRLQIEEIARLYQLPPVFLQDLSRATFSNVEQQDLSLAKHLISQWAQSLEGELNLKLFGRLNNNRYCEHNMDGLMRGDLQSRMEAHAKAIQNAIRTPNEVRALEGLPALPNGDDLLIQGATVPLGDQPDNSPDDQGDGADAPDDGGVDDA